MPGRTRTRPARATLAGFALLLAGCNGGGGAGDQTESPEPTGSEETTEPAEPEETEPELTIRDIDLAELEWYEVIMEFRVVPAEGHKATTVEVGPNRIYADVNGDGHEDVLASLIIGENHAWDEVWYIWTWNIDSFTASQVEYPVAATHGCGDKVLEVGTEGDAFTISEALYTQNALVDDCDAEGPINVTRHVALDDGWPVLTGSLSGDGGICPQHLGTDDLWPVEDYDLHAGPSDTTYVLTDPPPSGFAEVDNSLHLWLFRENWLSVHVAYTNPPDGPSVTGDYTPCAWIYLENERRDTPVHPDPLD